MKKIQLTTHIIPIAIISSVLLLAGLLSLVPSAPEKCANGYCDNAVTDETKRFCDKHMCHKEGCDKETMKERNYCFSHTCSCGGCYEGVNYEGGRCEEHQNVEVSKYCGVSNCNITKKDGGRYCSQHSCRAKDCTSYAGTKHRYCEYHRCDESGCENATYQISGIPLFNHCDKHLTAYEKDVIKRYEAQEKAKKKQKHSSSSSSKKQQDPDCDDYADFDEFMDDWDGRMPDGSDAEDYWEDW